MKNVTIIGAGFGGLTAVRALRKYSGEINITLIAPEPQFIYYPSLIWIPTELRKGRDLVVPLGRFFERMGVDYVSGKVKDLADGGRKVVLEDGQSVENHALIIASGGRFIKKLPGMEHTVALCEGIPAAESLAERIRTMEGGTIAMGFSSNSKEPSAMRGGPVFEMLFGLDTFLRRKGRRENFTLKFFSPAEKPGARLGVRAVEGLLAEMKKRDIALHLGHKIQGFDGAGVLTEGGPVAADLMMFMSGMTGPAWAEGAGLPLSEGGLIRADRFCRVDGFEQTYVVGDAGSFPAPEWLPKQAHMADLQAEAAVHNLMAEFAGRVPDREPKPELICMVDTLDKGILVFRDEKRQITMPFFAFHTGKRMFEKWYMGQYQ